MKPILFNTEMVRLILAGRKTQTRRLVKACHVDKFVVDIDGKLLCSFDGLNDYPTMDDSPIQANDVLYVRETWFYEGLLEDEEEDKAKRYVYRASEPDYPVNIGAGGDGWRPSIHMPKEAARIFLRVTDVRVERLQDISGADCVAEGCDDDMLSGVGAEFIRGVFSGIWDDTVKPKNIPRCGWDANPWVWVYTFERISKEEARLDEKKD